MRDRRDGPSGALLSRRIFGIGLGASALAACSRGQAGDVLTVSINNNAVSSAAPQFIAHAKGYFAEEGLDVRFISQESQSLVVGAVLSGDADMASAGVNAAVLNAAQNGDLVLMTSTVGEKAGFDKTAFFTSQAKYDQGLRTVADLRGRSVGGTVPGNNFHYALILAGRKYGFPAGDQFRALGHVGNLVAAVKSGWIDAGIYNGTAALALEQSGEGRVVGWAGDIGEFSTSGIYVSRRVLERRRSAIARFFKANYRATLDYYHSFLAQRGGPHGFPMTPQARRDVDILRRYVHVPETEVVRSIPYIRPSGDIDLVSLRDQTKTWQALDLVDQGVSVDRIINGTIDVTGGLPRVTV